MRRTVAILLAILLLLPTSAQAEWAMVGKDANHTGVAEITDRTIQKRTPVVSWDRGSSSEEVYSWGTSIGNFTSPETKRGIMEILTRDKIELLNDIINKIVVFIEKYNLYDIIHINK